MVTSYLSYKFGYAQCYYTTQDFKCCDLKEGIQTRTEGYQPSCEEILNKGLPKLIKNENDYYFVHTTNDDFYVFGINIEPGHPPETWWRGAEIEEVLSNCIKN